MQRVVVVVALCALAAADSNDASVSKERGSVVEEANANPIRKVVSLLQKMAKAVEKEADEEKDMFDKFVCWCKTGGTELQASIASNDAKVPSLQSDIESSQAELARLKEDVKAHMTDRDAAKEAMAQATALREKEHATYLKESGELKGYVDALQRAIPAIEKGMAGTLLQTDRAAVSELRRATGAAGELTDDDRQSVLAFLGGGDMQTYIPKSGEVVGILKSMQEDFSKDLAAIEDAESEAVKLYDNLMAAKTKEVNTLGASIEKKTVRIGELGISIANMKNELTDAEAALIEDAKFLKDLTRDCDTKKAEWDERVKTRAEELKAIHDTITLLNDDDALEMFKKTLPSASLLQLRAGAEQLKARALAALHRHAGRGAASMDRPEIHFLELALMGKKVDFSKVVKMIDDMLAILKEEAADDEHKQEYCNKQIDFVEDKGKELSKSINDLEISMTEREETIAALKDEIKVLQAGIAELDKSVLEATEQRKMENQEFTELMSSNSAAKELLQFAINRLNKFYSPKLYKAPPKRELSEEEAIYAAHGGEVDAAPAFLQRAMRRDAPAPPPETYGAYQKKGEETKGVIAMINLLVRDLDKEMTVAQTQEEASQKSYEELMDDSAAKRAKDVKAINTKESAKADNEEMLTTETGDHQTQTKELQATKIYEGQLHADCDWLLQNFALRKEARAQEADNLKQAKAILKGADFSLLQAAAGGDAGAVLATRARLLRGRQVF